MSYWLIKTEPSTYSFADLEKAGKTKWDGIRNFQARNFVREMKPGDRALVYHSGDDKAVIGVAKIVSLPEADPDPKKPGDWLRIEIVPEFGLKNAVPLSALRNARELKDLLLLRQSRLSVMPLEATQFQHICKMGQKPEGQTS